MNKPANQGYIPKNILVTGGCGFIGSHVVLHLVENYPNYKIVNFDKLDYCSSQRSLECIESKNNYKFIKGNILAEEFVSFVMRSEEIDTVLHFAAHSHVDNSFGNSLQFTKNNVLGTHVLLEVAKEFKIKRFIHVSTDEVYGQAGDENHYESSLLQPTNPYAATKAGAELIVQAYSKSFKLPTIITRGNNVYGPNQYPEKIIPKFIKLLQADLPCFIHGNGQHKRSFIYISDVVSAFDTILHKGVIGEIYNIGTKHEISNLDVAKNLMAIFNFNEKKQKEKLKFVEDRPFNDFRYGINFDKLTELGWEAIVEWEEGLQKTVNWYQQNQNYFENLDPKKIVAHPRENELL